jgi:Uma2 family endonuclease
MAVATLTKKRQVWTDEALEALPKDGHKYELLDGALIMIPAHANHSTICLRIGSLLFNFVEQHGSAGFMDRVWAAGSPINCF